MATQHIGRRRELANTSFAVGRSGLCAIEEEDAGDAAVRYDQPRYVLMGFEEGLHTEYSNVY